MLKVGKKGERKAVNYLKSKGYSILEVNYRCKVGEIDIIAKKDNLIVFCEVKTRSSGKYGFGFESVDRRKIEKILRTANHYIAKHGLQNLYRFDVISIDEGRITHIENAFTL